MTGHFASHCKCVAHEEDKFLWDLQNSIHLPNLHCWKKLYTSTKKYFARDLKIHYNSQQENKEVQQTNLQAAFSTNQSIEHRENTNQNILVFFFSSSLSFSCITEFFFTQSSRHIKAVSLLSSGPQSHL
jgi:hypothetical protein